LDNGTVRKSEVSVGDVVLYGKYSGTEVNSKDGEEYLIVREEDVLSDCEERK